MANRGPNTNSSQVRRLPIPCFFPPPTRAPALIVALGQFFITTDPAPWCDRKNVVFGALSYHAPPAFLR